MIGIARRKVKTFICLIEAEKEAFRGKIMKRKHDPTIAAI
jgi:hypothetical protein